MIWNIPNILTWARILAIPLLVAVFYLPMGLDIGDRNLLTTVIFVAAAITDWVDGWLARKWNQTSSFGAFLDPVADKLMVCTALVALIELGRLDPIIGLTYYWPRNHGLCPAGVDGIGWGPLQRGRELDGEGQDNCADGGHSVSALPRACLWGDR